MRILIGSVLACCLAAASADAQPPFPPNGGGSFPQQGANGPPIGINVRDYHRVTTPTVSYQGVLVVQDRSRRWLWTGNGMGGWRRVHFELGRDVIVLVNGSNVGTSRDVLANTRPGWNELDIYEYRTGHVTKYWVQL